MKIGERIFASDGVHEVAGQIVYGFCPQTGAFTDRHGAKISEADFIGIRLDCPMVDRVRLRPETWSCEVWQVPQASKLVQAA